MVEFGKRLRRIKLRHSSVDVYRYMCLTSCSAVFMLSYVCGPEGASGAQMAQMLCYNYLKLWCILYAVLACIGDCKAREGLVILCCFLALSLGL